MENAIHVGLGEIKVSADPDAALVAFGLGSCVAVSFYDPEKKIGGMIHVVLPFSDGRTHPTPGRYADTGIPLLLDAMLKHGASKARLEVKMAGGAGIVKRNYPIENLDVGPKNVQWCLATLKDLRLALKAQETGGERGRTFVLHIGSGRAVVRHQEEREI